MNLLEIAKKITLEAGNATLQVRDIGSIDSVLKDDGTQFTKGDEVSHHILSKLEKETGIPVLSEEISNDEYLLVRQKYLETGKAWIVDPLDGTKEYAKGLDEYAISVALIEDGKPTIGIVYAPQKGWIMYSETGKGAKILNLKTKEEKELKTSSQSDFKEMVLLVSSSELNSEAYPDYCKNLERLGYILDNDKRIRSYGSTTLKSAMIANGEGDYNFTFTAWDHRKNKIRITKEWDIAATYLLVREAGGMMTDCAGNDFVFGKEDPKNYQGIFTSNSTKYHNKLLRQVVGNINLESIKMSPQP